MPLNCINECYQTMERDHVMVSFKGAVTSELLTSVLNTMESKLDNVEKSFRTRKKVYSVLVECLQNLYHHNEDVGVFNNKDNSIDLPNNLSILIITNPNHYYEVKTGNFVSPEKAKELEEKIDEINKLDKVGLRSLYNTRLSEGKLSEKGTAGLGLIDIARKSGNKLSYNLQPIDDDFSFFCLHVKIN